MLKKCTIGIIIIVALVVITIVAYNNVKPSVTKEDITVEATLQMLTPGYN
jgi:hypothetical protein